MNYIIIFQKIKFFNLKSNLILNKMLKFGGYLVAPAASSLQNIFKNKLYYDALKNSSIAIFDSGYFCILLRIFRGIKVNKLSGYLLMKEILHNIPIKQKKILLINPSIKEERINYLYLINKKFCNLKSYVAPKYKNANLQNDYKLIKLIKNFEPEVILINIGGEKQEILANFIFKKISKKTSIFCLGAALGFFTGSQAKISIISDRFYLGWLIRWSKDPIQYFPRVLNSLKLIKLFF